MPARQRLTFAAIAAAIAIVAVIVLIVAGGSDSGSDTTASSGSNSTETAPDTTPAPTQAGSGATAEPTATAKPRPAVPVVVVRNGAPAGGIKKLTFKQGDQIRFIVRSDVADEIHVHGYDLMKDVEAGGSVAFSFPASITGIFEAELENRGEQIISLRVNP